MQQTVHSPGEVRSGCVNTSAGVFRTGEPKPISDRVKVPMARFLAPRWSSRVVHKTTTNDLRMPKVVFTEGSVRIPVKHGESVLVQLCEVIAHTRGRKLAASKPR